MYNAMDIIKTGNQRSCTHLDTADDQEFVCGIFS